MAIKPGSIKLRDIPGKGYCVVDSASGDPLNGGKGSCHQNRSDALKQMRAIYAKSFSEVSAVVPVKSFADLISETPVGEPVWIEAFPYGHWPHPTYTDTTITPERAQRMVKNFKDNVRGIDINTDYEHGADSAKGAKASGWVKDAEIRDTGVWIAVDFTKTARDEIANGEWKYFSGTMLDAWSDDEAGEVFEDVLIGGGLTNRPYMKNRVPLNFSEVIAPVDADVENDSGLRFKQEGDDWQVSTDGGATWTTPVKNEVAEWEHSEPGVSNPPPPRQDEDDRSGDNGSGSRRESPPPAFENNKEGSEVKLNAEALKALGLSEDATDEQVNAAITKMYSEYTPLKNAADAADRKKSFAEQFPEEFAEMERGKELRLTNEAKHFSEGIKQFTEGTGDDAKLTGKGFSALALEKIQGAHVAINKGDKTESLKMFGEALTVITGENGIVDYGEHGANREVVKDDIPNDRAEVGKKFADAVNAIRVEAGGPSKMSWGDAVSAAQVKHPELAKAYSEAYRV